MKFKIWIFLCCMTLALQAQSHTSLKELLKKIEVEHQVKFSYNDALINSFKAVSLTKKASSLQAKIRELFFQTGLVFEELEEHYYVIRKATNKTIKVCGTIIDANTQEVIQGVIVKDAKEGVLSNNKGRFELEQVLEDGFVEISFLGYETKKVTALFLKGGCPVVALMPKVELLNEVLITNYLTRGITKNSNGQILMNPKKTGVLAGLVESDVLQTLQLLPGVQSPDETASGLHIRGSTPDQNLVIYDGIKMYSSAHYFGLISSFNPYVTDQVELYRSGTEAQYGNNVGGVLNISTDKEVPRVNNYGLGITLTHMDAFAKVAPVKDKLGLIFSGRRSTTDVYSTITTDNFSNTAFQNSRISDVEDSDLRIINARNTYFFEDYSAKLIFQPHPKHRLTLSYLYNLNDLKFVTETRRYERKFDDDLSIKNSGTHADWNWTFNDMWSQNLAINKSNYKLIHLGFKDVLEDNDLSEASIFNKINTVEDLSFSYQLNYKKEIQAGIQYYNSNVLYSYTREIRSRNKSEEQLAPSAFTGDGSNGGVYAQWKKRLYKKWLLNIGARYQFFVDLDQQYLEPRLFVNYKQNNFLRFKFSTEIKHQSISQLTELREDNLGSLTDRFWVRANLRNAPVLKSFQSMLGFIYKKNHWAFDIEAYYKDIDGITFLLEGSSNRININRPETGINMVYGLDVLVKKEWNAYQTWFSYSYSKSRFNFDNLNEGTFFNGTYDSPHSLVWSHLYKTNGFEFSLGWRWRKGIPFSERNKVQVNRPNQPERYVAELNPDNLNSKRLPDYQRLDFSATYEFTLGKKKDTRIKTGISLMNITDKRNVLSRSFEIEQERLGMGQRGPSQLVTVDRLSLGFTPNAVFRVYF